MLRARYPVSRTANASLPSTQRRRDNRPCNHRINSSARSSTAARPPSSHLALHTSQLSPGAYAVVSCIGDWECAHACTGANANTNSTGSTSVLLPLPQALHNCAHPSLAFRACRGCGGPCAGCIGIAGRRWLLLWYFAQAEHVGRPCRGIERLQVQYIAERIVPVGKIGKLLLR